MANCKLNQIFIGEVASVLNYGAFIKIPGTSQQGLVHKSQVSSAHVDDVTEVLQRGERVWCKIISMGDDGKIGLSMKFVNQGNGTDLDINGVQLQMDLQKKKSIVPGQRKAIKLEAVFNTTCTKCGTYGHLSTNCFMSPGGKKYELIPDIEEKVVNNEETEMDNHKTKKKHKEKKSKRKKKYKKAKKYMSDSDTEETTKEMTKKEKHKRKKKKSSSDSNSSSSEDIKSIKRKYTESSDIRVKKCKYSRTKHPD